MENLVNRKRDEIIYICTIQMKEKSKTRLKIMEDKHILSLYKDKEKRKCQIYKKNNICPVEILCLESGHNE